FPAISITGLSRNIQHFFARKTTGHGRYGNGESTPWPSKRIACCPTDPVLVCSPGAGVGGTFWRRKRGIADSPAGQFPSSRDCTSQLEQSWQRRKYEKVAWGPDARNVPVCFRRCLCAGRTEAGRGEARHNKGRSKARGGKVGRHVQGQEER